MASFDGDDGGDMDMDELFDREAESRVAFTEKQASGLYKITTARDRERARKRVLRM